MCGMQRTQFVHKRFDHVKLTRSSSVVCSDDAWFVTALPSKFSSEHGCVIFTIYFFIFFLLPSLLLVVRISLLFFIYINISPLVYVLGGPLEARMGMKLIW